MTIIAAYPSKCGVVFVSDFRVTFSGGKQMDRCIKFIDVAGKMGLFLSGDTSFWKSIVPKIATEIEQITQENIFALEGPFNQFLNIEAINHSGTHAGAIGFLLGNNETHTLFTVKVVPQNHCILKQAEIHEPIVFGKGGNIPGIQQIIKNSFQTYAMHCGCDLFLIGSGLRSEILSALQSIKDGFKEYGISPTMAVSYLSSGKFVICGEEREGLNLSGNSCHLFKYEYKKDINGRFIIADALTGEIVSLLNIEELSTDIDGREFDPENLCS